MFAPISIAAIKKPRFSFHPGIAVAYVFAFGAILVEKMPFFLNFICPLKYFINFPCPACGAGRCVQAVLEFRLLGAFRFNPLFFAGIMLGILLIFHWLVQLFFGYKVQIAASSKGMLLTRRLALCLILLNYSYLVYFRI